jgi:hypothetical protein
MTAAWDIRDLFRIEGRFLPVTMRRGTWGTVDLPGPRLLPTLEVGGWIPRAAGGWRKGWIAACLRRPGDGFPPGGRLSFWLKPLVRPADGPPDPAEEAGARDLLDLLAAREDEVLGRFAFDPPRDGTRTFEWVCGPGEADDDLPPGVLEAARDPSCRRLVVQFYIRSECLQSCAYCGCAGDHRYGEVDAGADLDAVERVAARVLEPARARGADVELRLDARDLAAHPHLHAVAGILNRACASPLHVTMPGNQLADPARARDLSRLPGLDSVTMTVYGATPATHDRVSGRPGSFAEVMRAARNLMTLQGVRVRLNFLVTREGLAELPGVLDLSARLCDGLALRFPFSDSVIHRERLRGLYPRLDTVRKALEDHAADVGLRADRLVDFPACAVPPALRDRLDREQAGPGLWWYPDIPECGGCAHAATCIRVPEPYLADFGTAGLRPESPSGGRPGEGP